MADDDGDGVELDHVQMAGDQAANKLLEVFAEADADGSGDIDRAELAKVLNQLVPGFNDREVDRIFQAVDVNGDGKIMCDEFVNFLCNMDVGQPPERRTSFSRRVRQEYRDEADFLMKQAVRMRVETDLRAKLGKAAAIAKGAEPESSGLDFGGGYDLPMPCTAEGAAGLMSHYVQHGLEKPLSLEQMKWLLRQFTQLYAKTFPGPVVEVDPPSKAGSRMIVVGDTHGSLSDVLCIFGRFGEPSLDNVYLFNGDIADRGPAAVEIFMLLFAFFVASPGCVIINRGNHENEGMNALDADSGGGFLDEVKNKCGEAVYPLFVEAFKVLSLAVIIQKEYFVVHGGLTRAKKLTLKFLKSLKHSSCTYPSDGEDKESLNFCDLLWSDPCEDLGKYRSPRGMGVMFGPDVTSEFLERNRLKAIIRSHQMPEDPQHGTEFSHYGRCITVFSASNYCGDADNFGSVLVFESSGRGKPGYTIYDHYAPPLEALRTIGDRTKWGAIGKEWASQHAAEIEKLRLERELEKMAWAVVEKKPELLAAFMNKTKEDAVRVKTWEQICCSVVSRDFPWQSAMKAWDLKKNGKISVSGFLNRFAVELADEKLATFKCRLLKHVFEAILCKDMNLTDMMAHFDMDGDGSVDLHELRTILSKFDLGLTSHQLNAFVKSIFHDETSIKVSTFLSHFTVVYNAAVQMLGGKEYSKPWMQEALRKIGNLVFESPLFPKADGPEKALLIFSTWDNSGDGILQLAELQAGLLGLPGFESVQVDGKNLSTSMLTEVLTEVETSKDGSINYLEFLSAFLVDVPQSKASDTLAEQILTVIFRHREAIRRGCNLAGKDASGNVRKEDFRSVLESVQAEVDGASAEVQIALLVDAFTHKELGCVNVEDFLSSFQLRPVR